MRQSWQLINVDRREASRLLWNDLGACFLHSHEHILKNIFIPCLPKEIDDWLTTGPTLPQTSSLFTLPIEILDAIYEELCTLHDIAYLSVTCKPLLTIAKRHLLRATKQHYAPWVGCRLISLGTHTPRLDDLPTGLLTPAEQKEVVEYALPIDDESDELPNGRPANLTDFALHTYKRILDLEWRMRRANNTVRHINEPYHWRQFHEAGDIITDHRRERDIVMLTTLLGDGQRPAYPAGPHALCNLSKGEYVRADGLAGLENASLLHALVAKICWSTDDSDIGVVCSDAVRAQLAQGAWAGDRFCVTALDALPEHEGGEVWRDVTAEVAALLAHIWEHNPRR